METRLAGTSARMTVYSVLSGIQRPCAGQASEHPATRATHVDLLVFQEISKLMGSLVFEVFESIPGPLSLSVIGA